MLNNLSENLNLLMAKARINSNELAQKIGVPATTIKRIRNNEQANPTISTLAPIAEFFSVSLNQLLGANASIGINNIDHSVIKIPLYSWQECICYADLDRNSCAKHIFTERTVSEKAFALILEDKDLDFFPKNSILIVDPMEHPQNGDYVIVANIGRNIASVRKYIVEIDQIYLKSMIDGLNISILTSEYKILGVIIQYKVELKLNSK